MAEKLTKEELINVIKCWLQKFGNRDNETFNIEVILGDTYWDISLQYNFDEVGNQIEPNDWCRSSFKHVRNNSLSDRTEDELLVIIDFLYRKQSSY